MSTHVIVTLPDEVYDRVEASKSIAEVSDEDLLALVEQEMGDTQDRRLSLLLDKQQAGECTSAEQSELRALHEAVRRGLREPLEP